MGRVYDFAAMSLQDMERQRPIFTIPRLLGAVAVCGAGFLFLLARACFDVPIQTSVDLEHKGAPVLASRISRAAGWTITNGSHQERPASVYKFITFKPVAGERYQARLYVVNGCAGSNTLSPVFFIEMPTSGL